ncbi:hypothetical protein M0802_012418 [Mischocyttarus mexicanus]|nr:hypothetical protein M0802_012418 [Mischocyttarus mexicanus]
MAPSPKDTRLIDPYPRKLEGNHQILHMLGRQPQITDGGFTGKRPRQGKQFSYWNVEWSKQYATKNHKDPNHQEDSQKYDWTVKH